MVETPTAGRDSAPPPTAPDGMAWWWRIMDFRIGIVPAPVLLAIVGVAAVFVS
ncbi:MAG: hypothetical protein JWQ20_4669, partial [Conexibacter sp.]|nr:hypothetical protein [Conexibacter sp.]